MEPNRFALGAPPYRDSGAEWCVCAVYILIFYIRNLFISSIVNMPTSRSRGRSYARRGWKGTGYSRSRSASTRKMARIAQSVVNKNIEMKERAQPFSAVIAPSFTGGTVSFNSVGYSGGLNPAIVADVSSIPVGTGDNQRIGNKYSVKGIYINMPIQQGDASNNIRFILYSNKKQIDKSSLATHVTQVLSGAASSVTQWANPVDTDIFTVYMDKVFNLHYVALTADAVPITKFLRKFIKFPNGFQVQWDQNLTEPNNSLYLMAISDSGAVTNPGAIAGFVKTYFKDG